VSVTITEGVGNGGLDFSSGEDTSVGFSTVKFLGDFDLSLSFLVRLVSVSFEVVEVLVVVESDFVSP